MPNPALTTDIESRWRPLSAAELIVAQTRLDDAYEMLSVRRPTLDADVAAGTVSIASVIRVVTEMALRVLKNPDGLLQVTIDDYTARRDSAVSSGSLYITASELADVTPGRSTQRSVRLIAGGDVGYGYV